MKLAYKIIAGFSVVIAVTFISGLLNYRELRNLMEASDMIEHVALPSTQEVSKIKYEVSSVRRLEAQMIIAKGAERKSLISRIEKMQKGIPDLIASIKKHFHDDGSASAKNYLSLIGDLEKSSQRYFAANNKIIDILRSVPEDSFSEEAAALVFGETREPYYALTKATDELSESNEKFAHFQGSVVDTAYRNALYAIFGGVAISSILAVMIGWKLHSVIVVPVKRVALVAEKVAEGDLTTNIADSGSDEIGQLLTSISHMQASLISLVRNVRMGSDGVATASVEIAQGNMDLSSRTESQASSLEETSASMTELSSAISHNVEMVKEVNSLSHTASALAVDGGKAVQNVVLTMEKIEISSNKMADIISVIEGIAFQTNILALNAAVEAARAGDQGKGFAVVATEVRSLAGRSSDAAKEIKNLIVNSGEQISQGVELAVAAGGKVIEIVSSFSKVAGLIQAISEANNEQSLSVSQVREAIAQIDQTTQQNSALVEEMAAAAGGLRTQAENLVAEVSVFKMPG